MAEQIIKLFSKEIQSNLFPKNEFYKRSRLDAGIDAAVGVVQIPQAGAAAVVTKNPTVFPLVAAPRTDDVKEYAVDLFATNPIHIVDANEMVLNYSKRADVLSDHTAGLNTAIADEIAFGWAPSAVANKIFMSGTADNSALAPGATGTRKVITRDDLANLAMMFDIDDVPESMRNILIDARLYKQILKIDSFINFDYMNTKAQVDGQIGEIFGMKVFKRSRSVVYSTANAKKAPGAATAVTDHLSILAWADNMVRRAEGQVKVYSDIDNPLYLGSVFNAAVRAGGTSGRTDEKGVYALIQTA